MSAGPARSLIRAARLTKAKVLAEARRFYRYYVSKSLFRITVLRTATVEGSAGVAIVALYPRGPLLQSVTRLASALIDENYFVIAVVNKSSQSSEWHTALAHLNITLISRPNIGRDFGAYKIGYRYAEQQGLLARAQHLIFANDSMYYGPRSQPFIADFLKDKHPWSAMFVHHQPYTHGQSFFLRFRSDLFSIARFKRFWRDYYPSETKKHAIHQGEIKLSRTLTALGHNPRAFVSADRILSSNAFGKFTEYEKRVIYLHSAVSSAAPSSLKQQDIELLMRAQYYTDNVTHAHGTLASRVLGAPLKLDIRQEWVTEEVVRDTLIALGCPIDEAFDVTKFILKLPVARSARKMSKLRT